jgi:hypothetical protein
VFFESTIMADKADKPTDLFGKPLPASPLAEPKVEPDNQDQGLSLTAEQWEDMEKNYDEYAASVAAEKAKA